MVTAGIVKKATKAKVAVFSCGMDIGQTETKGTVLLKNANELLDFSRGEEKQLEGVSGLRSDARKGSDATDVFAHHSTSRKSRIQVLQS